MRSNLIIIVIGLICSCSSIDEKHSQGVKCNYNFNHDYYDCVEYKFLSNNTVEFSLHNMDVMNPPYGSIEVIEADTMFQVNCVVKTNGIRRFYRSEFSFLINLTDTIELQTIMDFAENNYNTVYTSHLSFDCSDDFEVEQISETKILINDFDLNKVFELNFNYKIQNIHDEEIIGVVLEVDSDELQMYVFDKKNDNWFLKHFYDVNDSLFIFNSKLKVDTINYFEDENDFHRLDWEKRFSNVNDSTIKPVMDLLEYRYDEEYPDFGLMDFNKDGYKDLVFEYYASCGTGVKFRVDVYFYDPKLKTYSEDDFSVMNPYYDYDAGILTSHYYGHGGGYAIKYKIENGTIEEIEKYDINITQNEDRYNGVKEVRYVYSKLPFKDTLEWIDSNVIQQIVKLPNEYHYEKMIIVNAD